ncbi:MAG: c-type cytochrome [Caldilineaceae bacterium]
MSRPTDPVARGEQLVGLIDCGGCHTPKTTTALPKRVCCWPAHRCATILPKILRPTKKPVIGSWSEEEIATFLKTGKESNGEEVGGAMAQQIERRFSKLTDADVAAIAAYLKSIPAVVNAE